MITLYVAGPNFGLPDPSPFVTKAEVLLKMSGVPYRTEVASFSKSAEGENPVCRGRREALGGLDLSPLPPRGQLRHPI